MNLKQRDDFIDGISKCFPELRLEKMKNSLDSLDRLPGEHWWEGGVSSGFGLDVVMLRYFGGARHLFPPWLSGVRNFFNLPRADFPVEFPAPSFPWLSMTWNLKTGDWRDLLFLGHAAVNGRVLGALFRAGERESKKIWLRSVPFSADALIEPALIELFLDFSRLVNIGNMVLESTLERGGGVLSRGKWSLRLKESISWPRFAALDMVGPFSSNISCLTFLLLDRRITELSFEEGFVNVYFSS